MKKRILKKHSGFTLIEMVTVIFIIALLVVVFLPNLNHQRANADRKTDAVFAQTLQTQVDLYNEDHNGTGKVSWEEMKKQDYLTQRQADKAEQKQLEVIDGKVMVKDKANS